MIIYRLNLQGGRIRHWKESILIEEINQNFIKAFNYGFPGKKDEIYIKISNNVLKIHQKSKLQCNITPGAVWTYIDKHKNVKTNLIAGRPVDVPEIPEKNEKPMDSSFLKDKSMSNLSFTSPNANSTKSKIVPKSIEFSR